MDCQVHSLLQTHSIAMQDAAGCLKDCVPVSTAEVRVQKHETHQSISALTGSRYPDVSDNDLVFELLSRGWRVGCDAELLPPRYWYEGNA